MGINGIGALRYIVSDVNVSTRFFCDFGLPLTHQDKGVSIFTLDEGSVLEIRQADNKRLPRCEIEGFGVNEVVWGVDEPDSIARFADDLSRDHDVSEGVDGSIRFVPAFGIPMALRLFPKKGVLYAPEPINAPGCTRRLNSPRKWRRRAFPKVLNHVVFQSPHYEAAAAFMCDRLGFRLTDLQEGFGTYLRAPHSNNHHNFLLLNADAPLPGCDGKTRFHHANFGVEDLDEIMLGVNHMVRQGWEPSSIGLGRHRIDSALFYYFPCPAGGEAEYSADADCVDDNWVPRRWDVPLFGYAHFTHNLPDFLQIAPEWRVSYLSDNAERSPSAREAGPGIHGLASAPKDSG